MKKRNFIAKDLLSKKYKPRIVRPKKGKGSFKRKKNKLKSCTNLLDNF
jgi:alternative ribosome-rescue factor